MFFEDFLEKVFGETKKCYFGINFYEKNTLDLNKSKAHRNKKIRRDNPDLYFV
jgi:hypothetical protein